MKTVEIQIADNQDVQWIDGVLHLINIEKKKSGDITERVKTLEDAIDEIGREHQFAKDLINAEKLIDAGEPVSADLIAFLKIRVITAALNEGWFPKERDCRYSPWYWIHANSEYNDLDDEDKGKCFNHPLLAGVGIANHGLNVGAENYVDGVAGSSAVFKTAELAEYAAKQFYDLYMVFCFSRPE